MIRTDGLEDFVGAVDDCHDHECCTVHKNAYKTDSLTNTHF